jgi:hypothetical protein
MFCHELAGPEIGLLLGFLVLEDAGRNLHGGAGPEYMEGEQGSDEMFGEGGDDLLDAADEETVDTPDVVNGGDGTDTCIVNENDDVSNCEDTTIEANPTLTSAASIQADTASNR